MKYAKGAALALLITVAPAIAQFSGVQYERATRAIVPSDLNITAASVTLGGVRNTDWPAGVTNALPIGAPTWAGTQMVADMFKPEVRFSLTNDLTFVHATNQITSNYAQYSVLYLFNPGTNRSIIFPSSWVPWGCTVTNTARSNSWTAIYFRSDGGAQTNLNVKLEGQ